jgi:acyl-CoA thioester hydrolase
LSARRGKGAASSGDNLLAAILKDVSDTPLLADYHLVTTIPLLWSDEDAFGHVNNIAYLRWCETARVEYLQRIALWVELPPSGAGPILASVRCDYKAQLNYPDTVRVGTRVSRIGNSSFQMEHCVVSTNLDDVAAQVHSTIVFYDYRRQKAVPLPAETRRVISDLEGKQL